MLMKILFALIALTVIVPVALYYKSGKTKGKECLLMNAISFFSILGVGVICTLVGGVSALAAGTGAEAGLTVGEGLSSSVRLFQQVLAVSAVVSPLHQLHQLLSVQ